MPLDEYAFGIRHDSPGLRAPPKPATFKEWAGHGDPALQWLAVFSAKLMPMGAVFKCAPIVVAVSNRDFHTIQQIINAN